MGSPRISHGTITPFHYVVTKLVTLYSRGTVDLVDKAHILVTEWRIKNPMLVQIGVIR